MRLFPILTGDIEEWWPLLEDWVSEFCERSNGSYTLPYVFESVKKGDMQTWVVMFEHVIYSVILTEVRQTEIMEFIIIFCKGEEMEKWLYLLDNLESYGREMGCKKSVVVGRDGWIRKLKDYKRTHVILEKFL